MDSLNEEIDLVLEQSLESDYFIFEARRQDIEKKPQVKLVIDALDLEPSSVTKIKKAAFIKSFGAGLWRILAKGLGKKAFLIAINKASVPRLYGTGGPGPAEADKWAAGGPGEPEETPAAEIIIPDFSPSPGGARFVGGLRYVGDTLDKQIIGFLKKPPSSVASLSKQFAALIRAYATAALINRAMAPITEELSDIQKQFIEEVGEGFEFFLGSKVERAVEDTDQFNVFVSKQIEILEDMKKKVEKNRRHSKAYSKLSSLLEPIMTNLTQLVVKHRWTIEPEDEETEDEAEDETGAPEETGETAPDEEVVAENQEINEDKLVEIVVDFNELRDKQINENFLQMFGGVIETVLGVMFGKRSLPMAFRGSERDVRSFANAISNEKSYIETAKRYGLDHPTTYKNKARLDVAIRGFEKDTGIKWPFE